MATIFDQSGSQTHASAGSASELMRPDRSIGGPWFDAALLWGAPALAFLFTFAWFTCAAMLPTVAAETMIATLAAAVAILTYAHLIAVAPRAYLNRDVFARFSRRLVLVPLLLAGGFLLSPPLLVAGLVLAVFWDVHHSAMQTFGLGRIYDMKAGNDPLALRRVDMVLNSALYIGPILAGASLAEHVASFEKFAAVDWTFLTRVPALADGASGWIRAVGIVVSLGIVGWAALAYRRAARAGYRMSAQKRALLVTTASVSIAAWGFAPPLLAFIAINLFHAVQYFALVWLKEGRRIAGLLDSRPALRRAACPLFIAACLGFGLLYWLAMWAGATEARFFLAPFVACSLLHFWYDGFVWSVRAKQV
ncbi:MAG TPA: hypothetical protein VGB54_15345 [Allosphingosinicella sp.]|jgi:hypothetical protein